MSRPSGVLALFGDPPAWAQHAKCRWIDPELFFAADGERGAAKVRREQAAKAVCAICPVRAECATYAVDTRQHEGVWGGLTETERAQLRRRARTAATSAPQDVTA